MGTHACDGPRHSADNRDTTSPGYPCLLLAAWSDLSHLRTRCRGPRALGRGTPSRLALLLIFQADAAIFIYVSIDMDIAARKLAP
jgi:hypothetical protein